MHIQTKTHCELLTSEKLHRRWQPFINKQKEKSRGVPKRHEGHGGAKEGEAGHAA